METDDRFARRAKDCDQSYVLGFMVWFAKPCGISANKLIVSPKVIIETHAKNSDVVLFLKLHYKSYPIDLKFLKIAFNILTQI